jgi:hypothetical protein
MRLSSFCSRVGGSQAWRDDVLVSSFVCVCVCVGPRSSGVSWPPVARTRSERACILEGWGFCLPASVCVFHICLWCVWIGAASPPKKGRGRGVNERQGAENEQTLDVLL